MRPLLQWGLILCAGRHSGRHFDKRQTLRPSCDGLRDAVHEAVRNLVSCNVARSTWPCFFTGWKPVPQNSVQFPVHRLSPIPPFPCPADSPKYPNSDVGESRIRIWAWRKSQFQRIRRVLRLTSKIMIDRIPWSYWAVSTPQKDGSVHGDNEVFSTRSKRSKCSSTGRRWVGLSSRLRN